MDSGHLRQAHTHLVAIKTQADDLLRKLDLAVQAPPGLASKATLSALLDPSRELRHHAMQVAAHVGAAEAVR